MELTDGIDKEEMQLTAAEKRMAFEDMMKQCGNPCGKVTVNYGDRQRNGNA